MRNPQVFLFDEPLSNLDAALRGNMRVEIAKLHKKLGATMIYVTHDQVEAMTLARRIVVLDQGVVQQVGTPLDLYHNPANKFVAGFIGAPKMNFLDVDIDRIGPTSLTVKSETLAPTEIPIQNTSNNLDEPVTLGIRPHHMHLAENDAVQIEGKSVLLEMLGNETIVDFELDDGTNLVCALAGDAAVEPVQRIGLGFLGLGFSGQDACLFDARGEAV